MTTFGKGDNQKGHERSLETGVRIVTNPFRHDMLDLLLNLLF